MKFLITLLAGLLTVSCSSQTQVKASQVSAPIVDKQQSVITKSHWSHGSENCDNNREPIIETYQHNENTYIFRQNKCATFEAPFIYVFVGKEKILVLDTGALDDIHQFSLYQTLQNTLGENQLATKSLVVIHSHRHSDHYKGDLAFKDKKNVQIIAPTAKAIGQYFNYQDWPNEQKTIELGHRTITVIATPGHQAQAITLYDDQTKWLMTGDSLYPGLIYVKDWQAYRNSIKRISEFSKNNPISAIMGAHIEMSNKPGIIYPIGTTYQPNEHQLDLGLVHLEALNSALQANQEPKEIRFAEFIIQPMNMLQKSLTSVADWLTSE
ncbi:MBL fold metallo-hydrolase [Thalassotalea sp. PLHSN55]|uniref:MBL fold metallo-hydrolase n=1 Tax=Thalassotalea sp. PLHSN55 TaxID=3435888 RepID=UPI003F87C008